MANAQPYPVNPGWSLLLLDLGIQPGNVLKRANLPEDLLGRPRTAYDPRMLRQTSGVKIEQEVSTWVPGTAPLSNDHSSLNTM